MTKIVHNTKHLALSLSASLVFLSSASIAEQKFNNIAFHPVPLSSENSHNLYSPAQVLSDNQLLQGADNFLQTSPEQYHVSIREIERTNGPFDPAIAQQAESLGDLLAKSGDFSGAIEAFEKSLHIYRVSEGLHSDGQIPVLKKMIDSEVASGNIQSAHELHESLLYLNKKIHKQGDEGYITAILEWADWNVDRLVITRSAAVNNNFGNDVFTLNSQLITAQENYIEAIELIRSERFHSPGQHKLLVHAEKKLAAINYIANSKIDISPVSASYEDSDPFSNSIHRNSQTQMAYFFNGSNALKRAIAYSLEAPQPDYLSIAEQMMTLGDWYLLFERRAAALSVYEDAYEVLDAMQASADDISRIMTPGMPVSTPDSMQPAETDQAAFQGYIDVEFRVSKFGIATSPEVIGTSQQDVSPVTNALIRKIRREKFRPAFTDGSATSGENVKLRYYYSYN